MPVRTSGPITISEIATVFGTTPDLVACAIAAGLPTTNIDITDFYGLSPRIQWTVNVSPSTQYASGEEGSTISDTFTVSITDPDGTIAGPLLYKWTILEGSGYIVGGDGGSSVNVSAYSAVALKRVGTVQCLVNGSPVYSGVNPNATDTGIYEYTFIPALGGGGQPL